MKRRVNFRNPVWLGCGEKETTTFKKWGITLEYFEGSLKSAKYLGTDLKEFLKNSFDEDSQEYTETAMEFIEAILKPVNPKDTETFKNELRLVNNRVMEMAWESCGDDGESALYNLDVSVYGRFYDGLNNGQGEYKSYPIRIDSGMLIGIEVRGEYEDAEGNVKNKGICSIYFKDKFKKLHNQLTGGMLKDVRNYAQVWELVQELKEKDYGSAVYALSFFCVKRAGFHNSQFYPRTMRACFEGLKTADRILQGVNKEHARFIVTESCDGYDEEKEENYSHKEFLEITNVGPLVLENPTFFERCTPQKITLEDMKKALYDAHPEYFLDDKSFPKMKHYGYDPGYAPYLRQCVGDKWILYLTDQQINDLDDGTELKSNQPLECFSKLENFELEIDQVNLFVVRVGTEWKVLEKSDLPELVHEMVKREKENSTSFFD